MPDTKTIVTGSSSASPFCAYGDDSKFKDALVYAFAIFHRRDVARAEEVIQQIKTSFGVPREIGIHCRVLFHGHSRVKAGLGHLTIQNVKELISEIVERMNKVPVALRYGRCHLPEDGKLLQEREDEFQISNDEKGILGILAQTCFAVPADGIQGPPAKECEIFASEDSTRIQFVGNKRTRADKWYSGFSDVDAPEGSVYSIEPKLVKSDELPLLQVADVLAFICAHAESSKNTDGFFNEQLKRITFWSRATFVSASDEVKAAEIPEQDIFRVHVLRSSKSSPS